MAVSALVSRWETGEVSPRRVSLSRTTSSMASESRSQSPSTPDLDRKASFIDLKDWVVELESDNSGDTAPPSIQLNGPPPLPPRKPSYLSLKVASTKSPPLPKRPSQQNIHTYPPSKLDLPTKSDSSHAPASSISSFHSISLSSDPATPSSSSLPLPETHLTGTHSEGGSVSPDESFENLSTTSLGSASYPLAGKDLDITPQKPSLPPRPQKRPKPPSKPPSLQSSPRSLAGSPVTTPSSVSSTLYNVRRVPPPPPSRTISDKASVFSFQSTTSTQSSTSGSSAKPYVSSIGDTVVASTSKRALTSRPNPVPLAARQRYESVFNANVIEGRKCLKLISHTPKQAKKTRNAAGWRGLSVDLIGADESFEEVVDEQVGPQERLDARIVRKIWNRSQLPRNQLKDIWVGCAIGDQGSLNRDSFVRGMWRIDEELRKVQLSAPGSAGVRGPMAFTGTGSLKIKQPLILPKPKPRPILR